MPFGLLRAKWFETLLLLLPFAFLSFGKGHAVADFERGEGVWAKRSAKPSQHSLARSLVEQSRDRLRPVASR